jgi:hypothetical protein
VTPKPWWEIVSKHLESSARGVGAAYLSPKIRMSLPVAPIDFEELFRRTIRLP